MTQAPHPPVELTARVARWALMCGGVALVVMAAVEAWQVFARYVINDSPGWTEPVALLLKVVPSSTSIRPVPLSPTVRSPPV